MEQEKEQRGGREEGEKERKGGTICNGVSHGLFVDRAVPSHRIETHRLHTSSNSDFIHTALFRKVNINFKYKQANR